MTRNHSIPYIAPGMPGETASNLKVVNLTNISPGMPGAK